MKAKSTTDKLKDILLKLAQGFSYTETVEEYVPVKEDKQVCMQQFLQDNLNSQSMQLAKKKIATHYVPPDMLAIKLLLQTEGASDTEFSQMSDEQLLELKDKLLKQLLEKE